MDPVKYSLIIMSEPLRRIFSGRKSYEIRRRPTRILGEKVALSEKGTNKILGVATIDRCLGPMTLKEAKSNHRRMGISKAELKADLPYWRERCAEGSVYAWVLRRVKRLSKPIHFRNPSGAVVWVRVPPRISDRTIRMASRTG